LNTEYIEINQLTYHIQHHIIDTNRPTIVFLHDSLGSVKLWRDFPEKLAKATNCNALVYDREGHGESSPFHIAKRPKDYLSLGADSLHQILQKLNVKDIILFGHSDGATIALHYAAKYPNYLIATIVEGVHVFVEEETLNGIKEAKLATETTNLKERVAKYHGDKTDMLFKLWIETWLSDEYRSWNIEQDIQSIQSPVLIFQGENDEFGTMEQVNKIKANVNSWVEDYLIADCGHNPHKEQPEFTLKTTTNFINKSILSYDETI
jgi:pimeloyl-ACP methyl ester carboxylesterase